MTRRRPSPQSQIIAKKRGDSKWRSIALFILAMMVSVSPRFHMGSLDFDKSLDLRVEDFFIIALLVVSVAIRSKLPRTLGLMGLLIATISWAVLSTLVGILAGWVEPTRAIFFIAKETEYYLFFLVTLLLMRAVTDLWSLISGLVLGAMINGVFVLYQLGTGQYFGRDADDYGVSIIGEHAAFNVSAYGGFVILIGIGFLEVRSLRSKLLSGVLLVLGAACLLGGLSRTALIAMSLTATLWMVYSFKRVNAKKLAGALAVVTVLVTAVSISYQVMLAAGEGIPVSRVSDLRAGNIEANYTRSRIDAVYREYLAKIATNPLTGLGKSITGTNLPIEAHNHYLRVFAEGGIVGLLLFLAVMLKILGVSYRTIRRVREPRLRAIALCSFLYAVFLIITSFAQDTFISARVTEIFWISVAVVLRIRQWSTSNERYISRRFDNVRPAFRRYLTASTVAMEPSPRFKGNSEVSC